MSDRFEVEKLKVIAATAKRFIDADREFRKSMFGTDRAELQDFREQRLIELYKVVDAYFSEGK
jgi:hypothetical protein